VSAQAEVAANQEQLFIAETAVKQVEDRLRLLIFDTTIGENWNVKLDPVDSPPTRTTTQPGAAASARRTRSARAPTRPTTERDGRARVRRNGRNGHVQKPAAEGFRRGRCAR